MSNRRLANLLWIVAVIIVLWLIWSRLRIVLWVNVPWYVALGLLVGILAAIYLVVDHLINRSR